MRSWLKSYGIVVWYVCAESITAIVLAFLYILRTGQPEVNQMDLAIAEMSFYATSVAGIIALLPFMPGQIKKRSLPIKKMEIKRVLYLISLGIILDIISSVTTQILPFGEELSDYTDMMGMFNETGIGLSFLAAAIITPFVEEFLFRYKVSEYFSDTSKNYRIVATAIVFGCTHINTYQMIYGIINGIFLGYIYEKNHNLAESILLHAVINAATIIIYLAKEDDQIICIGIAGLSIIYFIIMTWQKIRKKRQKVMQKKN